MAVDRDQGCKRWLLWYNIAASIESVMKTCQMSNIRCSSPAQTQRYLETAITDIEKSKRNLAATRHQRFCCEGFVEIAMYPSCMGSGKEIRPSISSVSEGRTCWDQYSSCHLPPQYALGRPRQSPLCPPRHCAGHHLWDGDDFPPDRASRRDQ